MKCPECDSLIKKENVNLNVDRDKDFIELDLECEKCGDFFTRIMPHCLIKCE